MILVWVGGLWPGIQVRSERSGLFGHLSWGIDGWISDNPHYTPFKEVPSRKKNGIMYLYVHLTPLMPQYMCMWLRLNRIDKKTMEQTPEW
jgi:hypothetical protein